MEEEQLRRLESELSRQILPRKSGRKPMPSVDEEQMELM